MFRFLAILLSIYVLALTAFPCDDVPEHTDAYGNRPLTEHTSHEHNGTDRCSPFCTCNCCATAMVCQLAAVIPVILQLEQRQETLYKLPRLHPVPSEIWTPPQLG